MIIPIGHERMEAQRLPYVTIGIIALNVLVFLFTLASAPKTREALERTSDEMVMFYMSRPYLEFPQETVEKFPEQAQEMIREIGQLDGEVSQDGYGRTSLMQHAVNVLGEQSDNMLSEEERQKIRAQEQEQLNELVAAFERAYKNDVYLKYGHIPARGGIFTLFSSMFMHGGFLHILFNMWFLWLSGCNIEDVWGRLVYPIFYLVGGLVATLAHGLMFPESTIPLVGASGAIAAVMGAFMVRMYAVKIKFLYFIWMRPGTFTAPAYIMLPLWLIQQLWEAFLSGESSGVAFWAHIGGFVFGAAIAIGLKVSGVEQKYIEPVLDKKTALLDEHLASGMTKLEEGDIDGAIHDLREAAQNDPGNPMIYSELSRAYFQKGNKKLGLRDFKRAVNGYMRRGDKGEAINTYIEISADYPEVMLDPPQQMKIAAAIRQRASEEEELPPGAEEAKGLKKSPQELYGFAALAYKQLVFHYQRVNKTLDKPEAIEALTQYADICAQHLHRSKDACQAYQLIMQSSQISPGQKQQLQAKIEQVMKAAAQQSPKAQQGGEAGGQVTTRQAPAVGGGQQATRMTQQAPGIAVPPIPQESEKVLLPIPIQQPPAVETEAQAIPPVPPQQTPVVETRQRERAMPQPPVQQAPERATSQPKKPKPEIPIRQRIKLIQPTNAAAKYPVPSVAPLKCLKVVPVSGGLDLKRLGEPPLLFRDIYLICVVRVPDPEMSRSIIADIFVSGQARPYRIGSEHIPYGQFFSNPQADFVEKFRQFILYIISHIDSIYLDQGTLAFLEKKKVQSCREDKTFELYEKRLWQQLMGSVRIQCTNCWEVYWIDGQRIPDTGAHTKCTRCGNTLAIQKVSR